MIEQSPHGAPCKFSLADSTEHVARCWGPERMETAWWQGPCVRRDYYRVHCVSGGRLWLFHDLRRQSWWLHGEFH
jgi:protein ImuB